MSNRTFACLHCRKLQRKPTSLANFACPVCQSDCVRVHGKLQVPAPRKRKKWDAFWQQYLIELHQLEVFRAGHGPGIIELTLLNQRWVRTQRNPDATALAY